VFTE
jgi:hypothetical protein